MKNELSIIVPVYNELNAIGPTIKDLCKIKTENKNKVNIEIIIVIHLNILIVVFPKNLFICCHG